MDKLADILSKTTAQIQQGLAGFNPGQNLWIYGLQVRREIEEPEEADAGERQTEQIRQTVPMVSGR